MRYLIVILIILGIAAYFNRSYANIYSQINSADLKNPKENEVQIGNYPKKVTLAVLGDSLAAGVGASSYKNSLAYLFGLDLSKKEQKTIELINVAVPGATSQDILTNQIPNLEKIQPDEIILLVGTNDVHNLVKSSNFKNNFSKILIFFKSRQSKKVFVFSIPYLGSPSLIQQPYSTILNLRIRQFNSIIQSLASQNSFTYVDVYGKTAEVFKTDQSQYAKDGFHPSNRGYRTIMQHINVL